MSKFVLAYGERAENDHTALTAQVRAGTISVELERLRMERLRVGAGARTLGRGEAQ